MLKPCHLVMGLMAIIFAMHNTSLFFTSESDPKCESVPTHLQGQYIRRIFDPRLMHFISVDEPPTYMSRPARPYNSCSCLCYLWSWRCKLKSSYRLQSNWLALDRGNTSRAESQYILKA
ncbi:hypothetical protein F5888DRAFT_1677457 [Russula emetica]|nr:hypothetical protein F5888DRAFT_1677457 [Russula emetica]